MVYSFNMRERLQESNLMVAPFSDFIFGLHSPHLSQRLRTIVSAPVLKGTANLLTLCLFTKLYTGLHLKIMIW